MTTNPLLTRCRSCDSQMHIERLAEDNGNGECFCCTSGYAPPKVNPGVRFTYDTDYIDPKTKQRVTRGKRHRVVDPVAVPLLPGVCLGCGGQAPADGCHNCGACDQGAATALALEERRAA